MSCFHQMWRRITICEIYSYRTCPKFNEKVAAQNTRQHYRSSIGEHLMMSESCLKIFNKRDFSLSQNSVFISAHITSNTKSSSCSTLPSSGFHKPFAGFLKYSVKPPNLVVSSPRSSAYNFSGNTSPLPSRIGRKISTACSLANPCDFFQ